MTQNHDPLLSIITPVKDAEPWLEECITSCLGQDFEDWEWVWVDDHSTDNTLRILDQQAQKDKRIRVFTNPGEGIIAALQTALEKSRGQLITRMDADDLMPPDRLQLMTNVMLNSPPLTVVTGRVKYFSDTVVSKGYKAYETWLNEVVSRQSFWPNLYRECVVASPNWIMRRAELLESGGFKDLEYPEDYDLVFKWFRDGFAIRSIPEVTLHWREHPQRTSRLSSDYSQEAFFKLKIRRFVELSYAGKGVQLWGMGKKAILARQLLKELNIPVHLMGLDKRSDSDHYTVIEQIKDPQLLIAVYPPAVQRKGLQNYLNKLGLAEGVNYWFL